MQGPRSSRAGDWSARATVACSPRGRSSRGAARSRARPRARRATRTRRTRRGRRRGKGDVDGALHVVEPPRENALEGDRHGEERVRDARVAPVEEEVAAVPHEDLPVVEVVLDVSRIPISASRRHISATSGTRSVSRASSSGVRPSVSPISRSYSEASLARPRSGVPSATRRSACSAMSSWARRRAGGRRSSDPASFSLHHLRSRSPPSAISIHPRAGSDAKGRDEVRPRGGEHADDARASCAAVGWFARTSAVRPRSARAAR